MVLSIGYLHFNEARYVDFDATPDWSGPSGAMHDLRVSDKHTTRPSGSSGGVLYHVTFSNLGTTTLFFRPRMIIVPALRWGGGGQW